MPDRDEIERAAALRREWEAGELARFLARQPEARTEYRTSSGLPVERVYTPADLADTPFDENGLPIRATATVSLVESRDPEDLLPTNPTSLGEPGRPLHEVFEGELDVAALTARHAARRSRLASR